MNDAVTHTSVGPGHIFQYTYSSKIPNAGVFPNRGPFPMFPEFSQPEIVYVGDQENTAATANAESMEKMLSQMQEEYNNMMQNFANQMQTFTRQFNYETNAPFKPTFNPFIRNNQRRRLFGTAAVRNFQNNFPGSSASAHQFFSSSIPRKQNNFQTMQQSIFPNFIQDMKPINSFQQTYSYTLPGGQEPVVETYTGYKPDETFNPKNIRKFIIK